MEKARALYEWIVDNTFRDPKVKGCGLGDIQTMLETKNLGGKCADLNALFVGFARSLGIPARDVYGIRVADSADFKSLGRSGDITKAQHCRAEFYARRPRLGAGGPGRRAQGRCSRRSRAACRSTTPRSRRRAPSCSAPGR